jgi:TonB family protein
MDHGIQAYYEARARSARRVSLCSLGVSIVFLSCLLVWLLPPLHRATEEVRVLRFGFEGPTQLVDLMQIEARPGNVPRLTDVGRVESPGARAGGGGGGTPDPVGRTRRAAGRSLPSQGSGESDQDLVRRALSGQTGLPVFQSEDLVLDHLERPQYPEEAQERGVEGHVSVMARVDTLGRVVEAAIMEQSGSRELDRAARAAVLQCTFRPYRDRTGKVTEVFAVFRFAFRIY